MAVTHPAPATELRPPAAPARRAGWVAFGLLLAVVVVLVVSTMTTGVADDSRLANPSPGPAPYALSPVADPVVSSVMTASLGLALFGVVLWLSWRQRRLHWAAIIALGTLFTGLIDPLANWATFAVLNPGVPHFPTDWAWFRLAPLVEPALSFLGGYSSYYVLTGLGVYWLTCRALRLRPTSPSSWRARHPLLTLFIAAWLVSLPLNALLQFQWILNGVLVYTQFYGAILDLGRVRLPLLILLYDPFIYATIAVLCHRDRNGRSTVLVRIAARLPARPGRERITSARQIAGAGVLMITSILVPISAFAALRAAGVADNPAYEEFPFPEAKVYDPYGDLERAGKPGPFYR